MLLCSNGLCFTFAASIIEQSFQKQHMTFFASISNTNVQRSEFIEILNKTDFRDAIATSNVQLVDVRTISEYQMGRIENALHIDYYQQATFLKEFEKLDKERPVYIYCLSGVRSQQAAMKLVKMGFVKIYDLQGGYRTW